MGVVAVAGLLALVPVSSTVYAATSAVTTNNTATKNDLLNADIIDESKTGSISIYKYDITAAEAAGDYKAGTYKARWMLPLRMSGTGFILTTSCLLLMDGRCMPLLNSRIGSRIPTG